MNSIKTARIKAKMKQEDVAQKLNVSQGAVSMWETGASDPSVAKLTRLAALFGCTVDELIVDKKQDF